MGMLILEEKALGRINSNNNNNNYYCYYNDYDLDFVDDHQFNLEEKILQDESNWKFNHGHEEEEDDEFDFSPKERASFWDCQEALIQEIVERNSMVAQKLRQEVRITVEEARKTKHCNCRKPEDNDNNGDCNSCLRKLLLQNLSQKGFNASLCTSKWKNTRKIPGGTHEYIEVTAATATTSKANSTSLGRKKPILLLIELEFKDQFKIAKACQQYNSLVSQLPDIFIGKLDCLSTIIRILCNAAKRSMKDKRIYMGPWRKRGFMEMKWSSSFEKKRIDEEVVVDDDDNNNKDDVQRTEQKQHHHYTCFKFSQANPAVIVS